MSTQSDSTIVCVTKTRPSSQILRRERLSQLFLSNLWLSNARSERPCTYGSKARLHLVHLSATAPASKDMTAMASRVNEWGWNSPHGTFEPVSRSLSPDQRFAAENAFSSVLASTIREAVGDALGRNVLEILTLKGLLDATNNSKEFDSKLRSLFGNRAAVLERIVVKDLNRKLGIRYDSEASFDYEKSLETAREVCFVESRLK